MAVRTRKTFPRYGLKEKAAAYAIGLASLSSIPSTASAAEASLAPLEQQLPEASYKNELQDEQIQRSKIAWNTQIKPLPQVQAVSQTDDAIWDRLAQLESGGNWSINTGNGYYGGLQFSLPTWRAVGGSGLPSNASREEQIMRAKILQARSGWGQWPATARALGLI